MLKVLLVEDHAPTARLVETLLKGTADYDFAVTWVGKMAEVERTLIGKSDFDIILCDLGLPDSTGIETLDRILPLAPESPVIVLTGLDDEEVALRAVRHGAQDFLIKGEFDANQLKRSILYAVERRRMLAHMGEGGALVEGVLNSARDAVMAFEAVRDGAATVDFRWKMANPACETVLGFHPRELVGHTLLDRLTQPSTRVMFDGFRAAVDSDEIFESELPYDHGGNEAWINVTAVKLHDGVAVTISDITDRIRSTQAIQAREERLRRIMETVVDGIVILDESYRIENFNPAAENIFGYANAEVVGLHVATLIPRFIDREGRIDGKIISEGDHGAIGSIREYWAHDKEGDTFPIEAALGEMRLAGRRHFIAVVRDITARKAAEEKLIFLANRDSLTGLANRNLFEQKLGEAITAAHDNDRKVGLVFLDLDLLKNVNDTLGHPVGDLVLRETARRLLNCVREGDTAARISGDEFVLVLENIRTMEAAETVAREVLAQIDRPFLVDGAEVFVTGSIGIVVYPDHGADSEALMRHVDTALHQAKRLGRNRSQIYNEVLSSNILRRKAIEDGLRKALERGEFEVHYQPKVSLDETMPIGAEALLRWTNETLGTVPPNEFIPIAEETGQINAIGRWVLRTACLQARQWAKTEGLPPLHVAVNLSGRQFRDAELTTVVMDTLHETGLSPKLLDLELTESILIGNAEDAIKTLYALKGLGVSLSIDDFGTGYSSLSYLKRFPIDTVKIDRSFIMDTPDDAEDVAITKAICSLAESLNIGVVAEGVETAEQVAFLRDVASVTAQGYFYSRPVPAARFVEVIRDIHAAGRKLKLA